MSPTQPPSEATLAQQRAADPSGSIWLAANAGSGKTRVLTDRVARLLLRGTPPGKILCLTYTKAAAAEMQNRLFKRLGEWAMMGDTALRDALTDLGEDGGDLDQARRLFAQALETPGGLKIQTIHSFCAGLLRRFPLEAGVAPQFTEMDDATRALLIAQVLDGLAEDDPELIAALATEATGPLAALADSVARDADRFAREISSEELRAALDLPEGLDEEALLDRTLAPGDAALLARAAPVIAQGSSTDVKTAQAIHAILDRGPLGASALPALEDLFVYGDKTKAPGTPKHDRVPTKATQTALGGDHAALMDLMTRLADAQPLRRALATARKSAVLHRFAQAFLPRLETAKQTRGWLDFDDLIARALQLVRAPGVAAWVLYRLDGGIDHILIDEAQDTAPAQWALIRTLFEEITAGEGARGTDRTLFIVGDPKQSIYSFQGAAPEAFDSVPEDITAQSGARLTRRALEFSFRSAPAIMEAVDAVIARDESAGVTAGARHRAFFEDLPGRVDLWPLQPPAPDAEPRDWADPVDLPAPGEADRALAQAVAAYLARSIGTETLPDAKTRQRTAMRAGDVLILVQRRNALFHHLIAELKTAEIPVAGADRLVLQDSLAVRDILSLLAFLDQAEDDLALAEALRSPLFGWSEDALYRLAQPRPRGQTLWEALRRAAEGTTPSPEGLDQTLLADSHTLLVDLRNAAGFARPHELIERILTRHKGRANLLARLGPEAEDALDELLTQALVFEGTQIPSLTAFLVWINADDTEVKRQLSANSDAVRVMTVHGAKGLEAPVVILPDTMRGEQVTTPDLVTTDSGVALWPPGTGDICATARAAREAQADRVRLERDRLLYVAMTRAESWLIVCGHGDAPKKDPTRPWHGRITAALHDCGAAPFDTPLGPGLRLARGDWTAWPEAQTTGDSVTATPLPSWIASVPPRSPQALTTLQPSALGGAKALAPSPDQPAPDDPEASLRAGRQLHRLLEHLPAYPREQWSEIGIALLAQGEDRASPNDAATLTARAARLLTSPDLSAVFGPGTLAEVPVSATLADLGGQRIHGAIDRLVIENDHVTIVDFKTNHHVPARAEDTPQGLLRQMAAYRAAVRQIFACPVRCAILWTETATLMALPDEILRHALSATPYLDAPGPAS